MAVSASLVKELREKTGAGMMDCKNALTETDGDLEKAVDLLRQKGIAKAGKRSGRETREGLVSSYIHPGGKIGVLVEVNCETDFVARNEDFQNFVKDIAMHVAASAPQYMTSSEISEQALNREREIFLAQAKDSGKPEEIAKKMVEGRLKKWYGEVCLMEQAFVKDPNKTIDDYLKEMIAKIGENMQIRRFTRFQLGEEIEGEESSSDE